MRGCRAPPKMILDRIGIFLGGTIIMKPLMIQDGIVMNAMIDHIPLEKRIVAAQGCVPNVRTQIPMDWPIGLTLHDAKGTASEWANKLQYIENNDTVLAGAHFFVDEQHIVQTLPVDEMSWQAGDDAGEGNHATIGIVLCGDISYEQAERHTAYLCAALMETLALKELFTHEMWAGVYCPRKILERPKGWENFVDKVARCRLNNK